MRGLARVGRDADLEVHHTLLGDADNSDLLGEAGHEPRRDCAALVDHEHGLHASALELSDSGNRRRAVGLLVAAELDVQVLVGRPAAGEEIFDGLEQDEQRALVVERPPSVHGQPVLAILDHPGERRMAPARGLPPFGRCRDDVLVGHEQYGTERGHTPAVTGPPEP